MAELEQALFPHNLPTTPPEGYGRLYFGAEFCPWRMPSLARLKEALAWSRRTGWAFTLVTPVLIEPFRQTLVELLAELVPALAGDDEVLVSDWGTIDLVRTVSADVTLILGRALSGQKRGPRILDLDLSPEQRHYFRQGSCYSRPAVELLAEHGIRRVELDNLLQGLAPLPEPLCGSLHWPYAMVTSSRNCPFRSTPEPYACPAPCGEVFTLETDQTAVPLYQAGNTQFLKNNVLPEAPTVLGLTRLVHHPQIPR